MSNLIEQIKQDQKIRLKIDEPLAFSIYAVQHTTDRSTTKLNGHFVHSHLLIDVLLRMKINPADKKQLINLCYNEYHGNPIQLHFVREFEQKYSSNTVLWWYTRQTFLYKILNKALRTQNIDVLFLFHFIISDLERELKRNQCQSPVRVYRGQVMAMEELNNLRQSIGDFISIKTFLSTSMNRTTAVEFFNRPEIAHGQCRVLFEIEANSSLPSSKPFADVSQFSQYPEEREILFMIGCIFRLRDVHQSDSHAQTWIVQMELCGDGSEPEMHKLFEHMKRDYGGGNEEVNTLAFGRVLRQMGKYDLAEKFYRRLLHEVPSHDPILSDLYYSLGVVVMDTGDYDSSLQWLHKSLDIIQKRNPSDYINISSRYCCIGLLYSKKRDSSRALDWYRKGIELFQQRKNTDHLHLAHLYNNMAVVYDEQQKYGRALKYYRKTLAIYEKHLAPDHSDIGTVHDNMGIIYRVEGDNDLAMTCHEQSLQIREKSLPCDHTLIAFNYRNIGLVHENKGDLMNARICLEKAERIYRQSLPSDHPDVKKIDRDIWRVCEKFH